MVGEATLMGVRCGACYHPDRIDIDRDILGLGAHKLTQAEVARKYGLGRGVIQRHIHSNHVSRVMSAVQDEVTALHGTGLLHEIATLYETTQRILSRAEHADDLKTAISAVKEARGCIETFARIGLALAKGEDESDKSDRPDLDRAIDEALQRREKRLALPSPEVDDDEPAEAEIVDDEGTGQE